MAKQSFEAKFKEFEERLQYAQQHVGVPSLVIYAFLHFGDNGAETIGGESQIIAGTPEDRSGEASLLEAVTLQGYVQSRLDVIKLESSAMYGPRFSVMLQREIADQVEQSSVTGTTAFQQSVVDLGRAYEPCIVYAATMGYKTPDGWLRGDAMAVTPTGQRTIGDYIEPLAAIQRNIDQTIRHMTKHCNLTFDQLKDAIREAMNRMPEPPNE